MEPLKSNKKVGWLFRIKVPNIHMCLSNYYFTKAEHEILFNSIDVTVVSS